ncbi:MAG TPA: hypothetical protein VMW49_07140 [Candidatus Dormibacteraeota bacterium]|nr:hypothetical protein [Candidatus Dormibacteraeota bacterium]
MSGTDLVALACTLAAAMALLADGPRGRAAAALCLGWAAGGLGSLAAGLPILLLLGAIGTLVALGYLLSARSAHRARSAVAADPSAVFLGRAGRVVLGVGALLVARWVASHAVAGTVVTAAPVFSCTVLWAVGLVRVGLARGVGELTWGLLASGLAVAVYLLVTGGSLALPTAALAAGLPAVACLLGALPGRDPTPAS